MSMLQVRWQLNAMTTSKKKTLAADYNPIEKRLRDFGQEAQELKHLNASAVTHSQDKGMKMAASAASMGAAKVASETMEQMPPVTLHSIVAELEGAGLLSNMDAAAPATSSTNAKTGAKSDDVSPASPASSVSSATTQKATGLSLGATGLLSAAGLLPDSPGVTVAAPPAPASEAGSSLEGNAFENVDDTSADIDPLAFLETCTDPAEPPTFSARAESVSSLSSLEVSKHNETAYATASEPALEAQSSKPSSSQGDGEVSPRASPPLVVSDPPALVPTASEEEHSSMLMNDMAFEDLAAQLDTGSGNLLSELHGLCEVDLPNTPGATGPAGALTSDELFLTLEQSDEKVCLLQELSDDAALPMTFGGFNGAAMIEELEAPKRGRGKRGKSKSAKLADAESEEEAAAPKSKRQRGAAKEASAAASKCDGADAGSKAAKAPKKKELKPKDDEPTWNVAPVGLLPPAPRSSTKFLPGAVETPAPAPTKAALGGKPASNGPSLGRTFSWQPIKFPVYT